jgi:hypothetical protein
LFTAPGQLQQIAAQVQADRCAAEARCWIVAQHCAAKDEAAVVDAQRLLINHGKAQVAGKTLHQQVKAYCRKTHCEHVLCIDHFCRRNRLGIGLDSHTGQQVERIGSGLSQIDPGCALAKAGKHTPFVK